jgi:hypothetical protein
VPLGATSGGTEKPEGVEGVTHQVTDSGHRQTGTRVDKSNGLIEDEIMIVGTR